VGTPALWIGFNVFVLVMLAVDLGLANRKDTAVTPKRALGWTLVWVALSLAFCAWIWRAHGSKPALEFLTAYLVEYSLSVDNLFVFLMVFGFFRVPAAVRHRVLFWGILGAFVMRATLIILGTALVEQFNWLLYIFGAFLLYTAAKMAFSDNEAVDPEQSAILKVARRVLPVSTGQTGSRFTVREAGRLKFTPLFLVLLMVEGTDLLFALDSIPAVLGISSDSFIIYTSNVCAILGLRSLFFVVASLMDKFHYLKIGLAVVLAFVGVKMLIVFFGIHIPIPLSLGVIAVVLAASIIISILKPAPKAEHAPPPLADEMHHHQSEGPPTTPS
jgi:tellurite resistance protein TerC